VRTRALAGLPFLAFVGLFLLYPTAVVLWRSITPGGTPGTGSIKVGALPGNTKEGVIMGFFDGHANFTKVSHLYDYYWHTKWNPALVRGSVQ